MSRTTRGKRLTPLSQPTRDDMRLLHRIAEADRGGHGVAVDWCSHRDRCYSAGWIVSVGRRPDDGRRTLYALSPSGRELVSRHSDPDGHLNVPPSRSTDRVASAISLRAEPPPFQNRTEP